MKTQPTHKKQNKKTRQLLKKNVNVEECATENEDDDLETGVYSKRNPNF